MLLVLGTLCLSLLSPVPKQSPSSAEVADLRVRTAGKIGPSSMRVDLVIVGDGYIEEDFRPKGNWHTDAARLVTNFFTKTPFKEHRDLFNVFLVEVISIDRGADDSPRVDNKNTALNCCYGYNGIDRLLVCQDDAAALRAAKNAPAIDIILVLVNDPRHGGSGGFVGGLPGPVCSIDAVAYLTAIHELGHSFGGLGDEYVDEPIADRYPIPKEGDLREPNLTLAKFVDTSSPARLIETLKWGYYLEEPGAKKRYGPGIVEGGYYRAKGVFRPARKCVMASQSGGGQFCYVCVDVMTDAINRTAGRSVSGGITPISTARLGGSLRQVSLLYSKGEFGKLTKALARLERSKDDPEIEKGIDNFRSKIDESMKQAMERLDDLLEVGRAHAAKELLALLTVSARSSAFQKAVSSKSKQVSKDAAFKKELKAEKALQKIQLLQWAKAPVKQIQKSIDSLLERFPETKTAERVRKIGT